MAKILLIETASEVCSAALGIDGAINAFSEALEAPSHAALLTLQIQACCEEAGLALHQLDAVALSAGPGAYTALRVGASVAKGICYALEKPLIALDTLQLLAQASAVEVAAEVPTWYVPMLDARRAEVWLGVYDAAGREKAPAQPLILENNSFEEFLSGIPGARQVERVVLSGNGMKKMRSGSISENVIFSTLEKCSARHMAAMAERFFQQADFQDVAYFEPFYMKPPNITTPNKAPF